jgi:FkbM family methyltransferase
MRFLRGVYEQNYASFVAAAIQPEDVFWDVGAHFGYYSLLASRLARAGQCHSFEPNADNYWYLEHHARWNRLKNLTAFPCAIAAQNGVRKFGGGGTGGGHLDNGTAEVRARSVDSLVQSGDCRAPTFVKIDVEGAEVEVLRGATQCRPDIVCVATHGPELHSECGHQLSAQDYRLQDFRERGLIIAVDRHRTVPDSAWKLISESRAHR